MKERFQKLTSFQQIAVVVFAGHLLLSFALTLHHFLSQEKIPAKMVVRTIQRSSPIQTQIVSNPKSAGQSMPRSVKKQETPKKTKAPIIKKSDRIASVNQKISSGKKEVVHQETSSSFDSSLIDEIESKLKLLDQEETSLASKSSLPTLSLPKQVSSRAIEEVEEGERGYADLLICFLQQSLDLPEYGEVKVDLEIDSLGRLLRMNIIEAKSEKNGDFLKKRLPELTLPCFNGDNKSNKSLSFTITFKNVDYL